MKITFITPLFPPDVSASAAYAKLLLTKLATNHSVTGIIYGHLPETVTGARLITIDKRHMPLVRLIRVFVTLWRERQADVIIVANGPATELPTLLLLPLLRKRLVFVIFDEQAATKNIMARLRVASIRFFAKRTITPDLPSLLPLEIHPFKTIEPATALAHEAAWQKHLHTCL